MLKHDKGEAIEVVEVGLAELTKSALRQNNVEEYLLDLQKKMAESLFCRICDSSAASIRGSRTRPLPINWRRCLTFTTCPLATQKGHMRHC